MFYIKKCIAICLCIAMVMCSTLPCLASENDALQETTESKIVEQLKEDLGEERANEVLNGSEEAETRMGELHEPEEIVTSMSELCEPKETETRMGEPHEPEKNETRTGELYEPEETETCMGELYEPIFTTRNGTPLDRKQIWQMMKNLADKAGVPRGKVFPHNLRHLFARELYRQTHDIVKLASILGHSSIETTRIYTKETEDECRIYIEKIEILRE